MDDQFNLSGKRKEHWVDDTMREWSSLKLINFQAHVQCNFFFFPFFQV